MNILFTLDYELYLGRDTGSVDECLIKPMTELTLTADKYGVKFTIFVDATYLIALEKYKSQFPILEVDYDKVCNHLQSLHLAGHDIQLHIHPSWWNATFDGQNWHLDNEHYSLFDFTFPEADNIFALSKETLERVVGKKVVAFRAGGFAAQPTEILTKLFTAHNIVADSSVYPRQKATRYDYTRVQKSGTYRFGEDICKMDERGAFLEFPIAIYRKNPIGYVLRKFFAKSSTMVPRGSYSDKVGTISKIKGLFNYTHVSTDGLLGRYLSKSYRGYHRRKIDTFVVIGHPKGTYEQSTYELDRFCKSVYGKENFTTISQQI